MMNVKQLKEALEKYDEYSIVVCMDEHGGWDNIEYVVQEGGQVAIVFGGGSPFSDEG
jgi:hypothetical protein